VSLSDSYRDAEVADRVRVLRRDETAYVEPEADAEAHVIRLLETEMHEQGLRCVVVNAPGTKVGHPYGNFFLQLGLRVLGRVDQGPEYPRHFWVTAKTSDGRILAVRWPSGVEE
jgi:hypothetical protein